MKRLRILPADDHLMVTAAFQKAPLLSTHGAFQIDTWCELRHST